MITEVVRRYWEREPCGMSPSLPGESTAWFSAIEERRYPYDRHWLPGWLGNMVPARLGWSITLRVLS